MLGSKDPVSGRYCQGLRIDDTDKVLVAGRAHGTTESNPDFFKCSTCNGPDGNPIAGFQATIIGTVKELGDGMGRTTGAPGTNSVEGTPILTDIQVSNEVACDPSITVTVEADAAGNECLIRSTLTDNPTDAVSTTHLILLSLLVLAAMMCLSNSCLFLLLSPLFLAIKQPTDAPTPRPTATSAPTRSTKTPKTRKSSTTSKSSKGYYGSKSSKSSELSIRSKSSKSSELV